ncbi:hypothetical protein SVA_1139 [Sulfurifustis variabilis]|uniref:DUF1496 domain-containing protein n=1 Tax=Sulfurifustis variabilis TaxID=1675686 RepID=A0A1B4V8G2_9GAMM|nr:hypothetical protein [Sulfurifustis variabilis]BAU47714.1 hypothetical protein SVA_1139 [Sulfurifustis variabilis]
MNAPSSVPQVGAPDPELHTSPIVEREEAEEVPSLDDELEQGACYFNDVRYPVGQYVRCGDEVLRCMRGVWVSKGETRP